MSRDNLVSVQANGQQNGHLKNGDHQNQNQTLPRSNNLNLARPLSYPQQMSVSSHNLHDASLSPLCILEAGGVQKKAESQILIDLNRLENEHDLDEAFIRLLSISIIVVTYVNALRFLVFLRCAIHSIPWENWGSKKERNPWTKKDNETSNSAFKCFMAKNE